MKMNPCGLCDNDLTIAWTDTHGVAQCVTCGAPYVVYHYENDKRIEREPELMIKTESLALFKACYTATSARLSAVLLGLSFPGGYDVATEHDIQIHNEWWNNNGE